MLGGVQLEVDQLWEGCLGDGLGLSWAQPLRGPQEARVSAAWPASSEGRDPDY